MLCYVPMFLTQCQNFTILTYIYFGSTGVLTAGANSHKKNTISLSKSSFSVLDY